jgi:predicted secreted protein
MNAWATRMPSREQEVQKMTRHTIARQAILVLALGLATILGAVPAHGTSAAGARTGSTPATIAITAYVAVGQEVDVAIKINPSTGYHWVVLAVPGLKVTSLDVPTWKVDPQHPMVGVPLIRVYQITATKAQATPYVVRLVEFAPGQRPTGATVVVTVVVPQ